MSKEKVFPKTVIIKFDDQVYKLTLKPVEAGDKILIRVSLPKDSNIGIKMITIDPTQNEENVSLKQYIIDSIHSKLESKKIGTTRDAEDKEKNPVRKNKQYQLTGKEKLDGYIIKINNREEIHEIHLLNNAIGDKDVVVLAEALKTNNTVTLIDLDYNQIEAEGAKALAKTLKTNNTITTISLCINRIGGKGVIALAEALKTNNTVTAIDLRDNQIGDKGVTALAEALKINNTVTSIGLGHNLMGVKGAVALAEALKTNNTVTAISLRYSQIGIEARKVLTAALEKNQRYQKNLRTTLLKEENIKLPPELTHVIADYLAPDPERVAIEKKHKKEQEVEKKSSKQEAKSSSASNVAINTEYSAISETALPLDDDHDLGIQEVIAASLNKETIDMEEKERRNAKLQQRKAEDLRSGSDSNPGQSGEQVTAEKFLTVNGTAAKETGVKTKTYDSKSSNRQQGSDNTPAPTPSVVNVTDQHTEDQPAIMHPQLSRADIRGKRNKLYSRPSAGTEAPAIASSSTPSASVSSPKTKDRGGSDNSRV